MWGIVEEITGDFKKLKEKGHDLGPTKVIETPQHQFTAFSGGVKVPLSEEEIQRMNLVEKLLNQKGKKDPPN